jgi:hypothetical protein
VLFLSIAKQLGGVKIKSNGSRPVLALDRLDDLLSPKWTPLYQLEEPTKEKLLTLYEQVQDSSAKAK